MKKRSMELCDAVREGGVNFCILQGASNAGGGVMVLKSGHEEDGNAGIATGITDGTTADGVSRWKSGLLVCFVCWRLSYYLQAATSKWRLRPGGGLSPATGDAIDGMMLLGT